MGDLIVLVLVCIATAALFAWLLMQRARIAPGEIRYLRLRAGLQAALPAIHVGRWHVVGGSGPEPSAQTGGDTEAAAEPTDEDVELAVRERLYGASRRPR